MFRLFTQHGPATCRPGFTVLNSPCYYRRAGKPASSNPPMEEWEKIVSAALG
jgi:hypothetical protein